MPTYRIALWCLVTYLCWIASPYFMYYVIGAPEPGTAPRYAGTLRIEGESAGRRGSVTPARHFIVTNKGEVEFHCGYLPSKQRCFLYEWRFQGMTPVEVGFDPYWGVDFMKFPAPAERLNSHYERQSVNFTREVHLHGGKYFFESPQQNYYSRSSHYWALIWLGCGCMLYCFLVLLSFLHFDRDPSNQRDAVPTEAEIAEKLSLEEADANSKSK